MSENKVGNIYNVHLADEAKYTAVQVIGELKNDEFIYLALDYYADKIVDGNKLSELKPLWVEHNYFNGKYDFYIAKGITPNNYSLIGNTLPLAEVTLPPNYDNSWNHIFQIVMQNRWLSYPEIFRKNFMEAANSADLVSIQGKNFKLSTSNLTVNQAADLQSADDLEKLPALSDIAINKRADWLIPLLNTTPYIYQLLWNNHDLEKIDLSSSGLSTISLSGKGLQELNLGIYTTKLTLTEGIPSEIKIKTKNNKIGSLTLHNAIPTESMKGLEVEELTLADVKSVNIAAIYKIFPNVKSLLLQGLPGVVEDVSSLKDFKNLSLISFNNLFEFNGEDFPNQEQMPNIEKIWMTSISLEAGKEIQKKYPKASGVDINIAATRSEDWIKKNMK